MLENDLFFRCDPIMNMLEKGHYLLEKHAKIFTEEIT